MSCNLNACCTCISLGGAPDTSALNALPKSCATSILPELLADDDHDLWCAIDGVRNEVEEASSNSEVLCSASYDKQDGHALQSQLYCCGDEVGAGSVTDVLERLFRNTAVSVAEVFC